MNDPLGESPTSPDAEPATKSLGPTPLIVLLVINSLAAVGSLFFLPLTTHIYSCTASEKWCHLQAFIVGLPSALVLLVLLVATLSVTVMGAAGRARSLIIACWLVLAVPSLSLGALFVAVAHNSRW